MSDIWQTLGDFLAEYRPLAQVGGLLTIGTIAGLVFRAVFPKDPVASEDYVRKAAEEIAQRIVESRLANATPPPTEQPAAEREITIADIQRAVADYFSILVTDLISTRRSKKLVRARHIAMYLCRLLTASSYEQIGVAFGGRDAATVIAACQRIEKLHPRLRSLPSG